MQQTGQTVSLVVVMLVALVVMHLLVVSDAWLLRRAGSTITDTMRTQRQVIRFTRTPIRPIRFIHAALHSAETHFPPTERQVLFHFPTSQGPTTALILREFLQQWATEHIAETGSAIQTTVSRSSSLSLPLSLVSFQKCE
jgi:hypothetical protein